MLHVHVCIAFLILGYTFLLATFIAHVRAKGVVSLQSVADPSLWLRITAEGMLDGRVSSMEVWLA